MRSKTQNSSECDVLLSLLELPSRGLLTRLKNFKDRKYKLITLAQTECIIQHVPAMLADPDLACSQG